MGDTYDFNWHEVSQSNYENENYKLVINNIAVAYQKTGALQPFNWTASISGRVQGGNK